MQVYHPPPEIVFLGKYRCKRLLGRGAFGSVHLVESEGEELALKLIEKERMSGENDYLVEYLRGEVACMREMQEEHCVTLFDFQQDEKYFYLVIEYCDGGDLLALQQSLPEKVFPLKQALQLMSQVVKGVQALHKRGYLHRDIKPQNVLVKTFQGCTVLKMADFGFAKKASFGTGTVIGTEYFMSPEIYAQGVEGSEGEKYGFEVDVWACGVLLFYMLNACFPFQIQPAWTCETKLEQLTKQAKSFSYRKIVPKTRKRIVQNCTDEMEDLFSRIFSISRKERITFSEIMIHPAFSGCFIPATSSFSIITTSECCEFERERQVVSLMIQEMKFPAEIAERIYQVGSSIGQLQALMFAYILTKYHLFLLSSFSRHFNAQNCTKKHAGFDWTGLFSSAYTAQIKQTIQQSIKTARIRCQSYEHKCIQDMKQICELNEHLGNYLKDRIKSKAEQKLQDEDELQKAYKWGANLVYRKLKEYLKINKILSFYGLLSLVCICYIFKSLFSKEEPKKSLFAAYLNQQPLTLPIFSFKRFLEYSDRCKKEDYVALAKSAIQRCSPSSIS